MNILIPIIIVVVIGLIAGIILTVAANVMKVAVNEKIEKLIDVLPGANCGACGFAGCNDYATALVEGDNVSTGLCPVGGAAVAADIAEVLGVEVANTEPMTATVKCHGYSTSVRKIMQIDADWSCKGINHLYGGKMLCRYGCIGQGDCQEVCPQNAIDINDGLAVIKKDLCVGCGICKDACPKGLISIHPKKQNIQVACMSKYESLKTVEACSMGCIACGKCVETCKFDSIHIENNKAVIDYEKCKLCGMCVKVCPTGALVNLKRK